MIQSATVLTIVLIAASTYVTRSLGYVLLGAAPSARACRRCLRLFRDAC